MDLALPTPKESQRNMTFHFDLDGLLSGLSRWGAGRTGPELIEQAAEAWNRRSVLARVRAESVGVLTLELGDLGAPDTLLDALGCVVAADLEQADTALVVARHYGLGATHVAGERPRRYARGRVVSAVVWVGVVGKTVSALQAAAARPYARDRIVSDALRQFEAEDNVHAELAWDVLDWALGHRELAASAVQQLEVLSFPVSGPRGGATRDERTLLAHGVVPVRLRRLLRGRALGEAIGPRAARMLDAHVSPRVA